MAGERHRGGASVRRVNEGAAHKKLAQLGWDVRRGTVCPDCVARKKAPAAPETTPEPTKDTEAMEAVKEPALREPTPKQKREIIGLLEVVYDDAAKRFKDGESDKTVADAIGGGVLFGWVARIREELFGPDTRNQEVEALRKDLGRYQKHIRDIELVDYKVRILDSSHGTDATTHVLLEMAGDSTSWTTVGVAPNIVEASWIALLEALAYGLWRKGVPVR